MEYRPHIWITGESESGKSTVIRRLAKVILGKIGVFMEGGTTEASIREIMGNDARPLILDEAEASEQAMAGIIALARKATKNTSLKGCCGQTLIAGSLYFKG